VVSSRPATADDVPALSALAKRTWLDAFGHTVDPETAAVELDTTRSEAFFRAALETRTTLVAEEDGRLVGYVQFGDVDIPEADAGPGDRELHRVYVETAQQGRGIGRRLVEEALRDPRLAEARRIFLQVWEENERAVRLYESLGFHPVGTTAFTIGSGQVVEDVVMLLEVQPQ